MLTGSQAKNNETVAEYLHIMAAVLQAVYPGNLTSSESEKLASAITKFEREANALKATDDSRADENASYTNPFPPALARLSLLNPKRTCLPPRIPNNAN